jgi:hypothetical protein
VRFEFVDSFLWSWYRVDAGSVANVTEVRVARS